MFGDLDWPVNASRGLSAIAEFQLVIYTPAETQIFTMGESPGKQSVSESIVNPWCSFLRERGLS